jgi:lipopolysaccharide heptosyltransferase II
MSSLDSPRILVIRRRYLGDIVLLGSVFRNLRLHWPQARLTALVEPAYAEVLALNPDVDAVLPLPKSRAGLGPWWQALRALRGGRFTHVFNLDNVPKAALLARWTGAPFRAGLLYERPHRLTRLYTHRVIDPPEEHERQPISEYFLKILATAGVPIATREIRLVPREADLAFARELLESKCENRNSKILLVHPGSRSACRLWPAERFAAVCDRAQRELEAQVLLIGGPAEPALLAEIQRHARTRLSSVTVPLSVGRFAALAQLCPLLLCHDSGPMHVAAAVGTPVVALLGSQNPVLFAPPGAGHTVLQPPRPCRTCVAPGQCVPGDSYRNYCVRNITVDTVWAALRRHLTGLGCSAPGSAA